MLNIRLRICTLRPTEVEDSVIGSEVGLLSLQEHGPKVFLTRILVRPEVPFLKVTAVSSSSAQPACRR